MKLKTRNFLRRFVSLSLISLFILLSVTACGSQQTPAGSDTKKSQQPQSGGILKIVENAEGAQAIGVPWEVRGIDSKLQKPVVESLLRESINATYTPWLAESWKPDPATNSITVTLRKGVKFHDGTDFNAKAAKWNLDQEIKGKNFANLLSVDVIDDNTIKLNMEKYQNNILNALAGSQSGMVSPTAFEKNGLEGSRFNPVGTGPFVFEKYDRGNVLSFKKWDGYWQKGLPYLDGIQFLFMRDPMTQMAAMKATGADRIDVLAATSGDQALQLKTSGLPVVSGLVGPISLIPDSKDPKSPFSNQKVREALSYAIDRDAIVKARGFGYWQPAYQLPNPNTPSFIKDLQGKYDPEKAKQLLTEAGYPSGFKTKIIVMPALVDKDAMVAVQQMLGKVGITVELEFPDSGGFNNYRFKGWSGLLAQHTRALATFNITNTFYWPEVTGQFPSLLRPAGFLDLIIKSLRTPEPDPTLGQQMTKVIYDNSMIIPVYYQTEMYGLQANVHDTGYFDFSPSTVSTFEKTWLGK